MVATKERKQHVLARSKPRNDRVVVRRDEPLSRSAGGIIIPDSAKSQSSTGVVIAVGPGKIEYGQRVELDLKVGDAVVFGKYAGNEVKDNSVSDPHEYVILKEDDILAVIPDDDD